MTRTHSSLEEGWAALMSTQREQLLALDTLVLNLFSNATPTLTLPQVKLGLTMVSPHTTNQTMHERLQVLVNKHKLSLDFEGNYSLS